MRHWLFKSEPGSYSIEDLRRDGSTFWDGVRNYQARNLIRDDMRVGDPVLFYHSNSEALGVAGIARVSREAYPDHTALDPESPYFDPRASPDDPRWYMVEVEFVEAFPRVVSLEEIRGSPGLDGMPLVNKSRLSVQPVAAEEFEAIVGMGRRGAA